MSRFDSAYNDYVNIHLNDDIYEHFVSWNELPTVVEKVKCGKAMGSFIKPQHLFNDSPKLLVHLHLLFNSLIQHGYVPSDFLIGTVTPVVKDRGGMLMTLETIVQLLLVYFFLKCLNTFYSLNSDIC
jgi:hypothetical protein